MLDSMNAALVSPEERDLHLYDALSNPVLAAGHLRLRGLRRSNPRALRASVLQAIAALEVIAGFRLPELWGANEPSGRRRVIMPACPAKISVALRRISFSSEDKSSRALIARLISSKYSL